MTNVPNPVGTNDGHTYRVGRDEPTSPARADRSVRRISPHLRRWKRCRHRSRSARRRPHRPPPDLPRTPGAAVRPGPVDRHRQRQPQRHVRQRRRVPTVDIQDGRGPQHRQPRRSAADVRGRQAPRVGGPPPPTASVPIAQRPSVHFRRPTSRGLPAGTAAASRSQPMYPSAQQPRYPTDPAAAATRAAPGYAPSGPQVAPAPSRPATGGAARSATSAYPALSESVTAMGPTAAPRSSEGNLATSMLKILRPGRPADAPRRVGQDRPQHRQRHRHPRRAGVAPPRDTGPEPPRAPRSATTAASTAPSSTARASTPRCCTRATPSPSATSTWCSAAARWSVAPRPPPPPAPAASTCTASRGPSRATRRCWTTSR